MDVLKKGMSVNMKLLLVALNAKYIHSNLAVYSLKSYANIYSNYIDLAEFTINQSDDEVLKELYKSKADIVAFSCYIWNISMVKRLMVQLRKVLPDIKIWLGGPEVSYDAEKFMRQQPVTDGIVIGEGEQTFLELLQYYVDGKTTLDNIAGIVFRDSARITSDQKSLYNADNIDIVSTDERLQISLDNLPFPYESVSDAPEALVNRIIYYESSRGCPFSCSYCLSSIDKKLRFRDTGLVKKELKTFIDNQIAQVKFVDRTFNCDKHHAMEIWRFIKEHDNGITNFHFEISADLLDEDELALLASLRPGQIQFEIGVQTTNTDTIKAIHRKMNLDRLSSNVMRIKEGSNIHLHLDLIAGLPLEDYASFTKSFDYVYGMKPDQLQLGFLKVLKGSCMEKECSKYGIIYRDEPPYEVLYTACLSYEDILKIKGVCEMVEVYYNSGQFTYSMMFLEHGYQSPMKLYEELYEFYEMRHIDTIAHNRLKRYEILLDFYQEVVLESQLSDNKSILIDLFKELLIYDLYLREDLKSRPSFYSEQSDKEELKTLYVGYRNKRKSIHIELFRFDIIKAALTGKVIIKNIAIIFDYGNKNRLNNSAEVEMIEWT